MPVNAGTLQARIVQAFECQCDLNTWSSSSLSHEGRATRAVARGLRDNYHLALDSPPPPSLTTGLLRFFGASTVSRRRVPTLLRAVDHSYAHVEVALPNLEDPLGIRRQRHTCHHARGSAVDVLSGSLIYHVIGGPTRSQCRLFARPLRRPPALIRRRDS